MRNVLVIHYSQTGQLTSIANNVAAPLEACSNTNVEYLELSPSKAFPFPWPFMGFFHIFPESVKMQPIAMEPVTTKRQDYDLIILAYQVWFLSPSLPISSFLQSEDAKALFNDTPVVTLIGCRGMWLSAQEKMKLLLESLNARLVDNVVLSDECGAGLSFLATPMWMFTGRKKPYSWVPKAGVSDSDIAGSVRFGHAIAQCLNADDTPIEQPMLKGLGAVVVNEKFIASERVGQHSFRIWSKIISAFGPMYSKRRSCGLILYVLFLLTLILTVVPISALIKKLISPWTKTRTSAQKAYFSKPSGE